VFEAVPHIHIILDFISVKREKKTEIFRKREEFLGQSVRRR
jgi:hypothetical protein